MRKQLAVGAVAVAGVVAARRLAPGRLKPRLRQLRTRVVYELLSTLVPESIAFTNYGYAALDGASGATLALAPEDEPQRYGMQLYHAVAGQVDLQGKDVLEVGCGRGGGAAFVARYLAPRSVVGIDIAARAIAYARAHQQAEGLSFALGDAEHIPFPSASFDAVVNVESSHSYPSMEGFLAEVRRVLRPGGALLFADMRARGDVARLRQQFEAAGFEVAQEEPITAQVVRALELDSRRRVAMIEESVPKPLRRAAWEFTGAESTGNFRNLRDGRWEYVRLVARKPAEPARETAGAAARSA